MYLLAYMPESDSGYWVYWVKKFENSVGLEAQSPNPMLNMNEPSFITQSHWNDERLHLFGRHAGKGSISYYDIYSGKVLVHSEIKKMSKIMAVSHADKSGDYDIYTCGYYQPNEATDSNTDSSAINYRAVIARIDSLTYQGEWMMTVTGKHPHY